MASRESSVGEVSARGLTAAEATARLQAEGHNELPHQDQRSTQRIIVEVVREPMLLLLWLGAGVYAVLGDLGEALILVVFALLSIGITVVQDREWVSFMWSYPNLIPLDPATIEQIAARVERFQFDRIYGGWWGRVVVRDGAAAVRRSADRYIAAFPGTGRSETGRRA